MDRGPLGQALRSLPGGNQLGKKNRSKAGGGPF
jgi:hypothetical protein